jgi:hypothetical protein
MACSGTALLLYFYFRWVLGSIFALYNGCFSLVCSSTCLKTQLPFTIYRRLVMLFRLSAVSFKYHNDHQHPIHGQILKPITYFELSPALSGIVIQMGSLASKNSGASLKSELQLFYVFRFMRFRYILADLGSRAF